LRVRAAMDAVAISTDPGPAPPLPTSRSPSNISVGSEGVRRAGSKNSTPVMQRMGWRRSNSNASNSSAETAAKIPAVKGLQNMRSAGVSQISSGRTSNAEAQSGTLEQIFEIKRLIEEKERAIRESPAPVGGDDVPSEEVEEKAEKQLLECVNEFISTEANYLEDLRFTTREYSRPLHHLLDSQAHYKIFSNHEQLLELHVKLDQALGKARDAVKNAERSEATVQAFIGLLPYFKMYAAYCANYPHVAASLAQVRMEDKVAQLLAEKHAQHHTTLQALLFRPVQRMCLYPLLFKRMVNCTSEGLPLHKLCEQAFNGVQQLNAEVNENVRNMESKLHMMEVLTQEVKSNDIQHLFEAPRSLVREALVDMKCHSASIARPDWRIRRPYKWYVFSDYLLVCRPDMISAGWHKKELWPLAELYVSTNNPAWLNSSERDASDVSRTDSHTSRTNSHNSRSNSHNSRNDSHFSTASVASVAFASASGSNSFGHTDAAARTSGDAACRTPRGDGSAATPRAGGSLRTTLKIGTMLNAGLRAAKSASSDDTDRTAETSIADSDKTDGTLEKAEVLHLHVGGQKYKCWAQNEDEMLSLVSTITSLRKALKSKNDELAKRRATSVA